MDRSGRLTQKTKKQEMRQPSTFTRLANNAGCRVARRRFDTCVHITLYCVQNQATILKNAVGVALERSRTENSEASFTTIRSPFPELVGENQLPKS